MKNKNKPSGAYWRNLKKMKAKGIIVDHENKTLHAPEYLVDERVKQWAKRYKLVIQTSII